MNIFLDIETIPSQDENIKKAIADSITAPGQYKKPESIKEWLEANRDSVAEEEWKKTSFDGGRGQICCISVAVGDHDVQSFYSEDWRSSEHKILTDFFRYLHENYDPSRNIPPSFVGHNVVAFDLRFIFQRAAVLGVRPPHFIPFSARPWDKAVFDTMIQWAGHSGRVSLDKLCQIFNLPQKGSDIGEEIDGSMVWDFVRDGKISQVVKYCEGDVERVREIFKRLTFTDAA